MNKHSKLSLQTSLLQKTRQVELTGEAYFEVKKGDRIAQMVIERIALTEILEVDNLEETKRGDGGFGSTGVEKKLD